MELPLSPRWLRGAYSIRAHLIAFGLATLLPVTILVGVLLVRSAHLERAQLDARLIQVAADLANDLDRELDRHMTVLRTLATLPSLANADWETFHSQAASAMQGSATIILIDRELRQLVNTAVPFGHAPPLTGDPETARRTIESKQPAVSDLFFGLATRTYVYNVAIPITRDGDVQYILLLGRHAGDLLDIVRNPSLPPEWTVVILDRKGVVLARSTNHEKWVGSRPDAFAADLADADRGVRNAVNPDNEPVLRAVARSDISNWLVTVSVPLPIAEAPLISSAWTWTFITVVALIVTAVSAWLFARTLSVPLAAATDAAAALGRGELIESPGSSLKEANAIMTALRRAGIELNVRAEHQRFLLNELSHRAKNLLAVVQALVMRSFSGSRSLAEGKQLLLERLHALARAHELQMTTDWKGAPIKDIIAAELEPFAARVDAEGPDLTINGEMVQTLGLLLHELATNAAKYGALSNDLGRISMSWSTAGSGDDARFRFRWQETGGPTVSPPVHRGFGSMLLNGLGSASIKPKLAFAPDGFIYEFDVALDYFVRTTA
ncbi:MAG: hypothetical protein FJX35_21210 [Alphaproteobacteria bacterium]|nr:hypothetical protein [Alphaproteobacteria bacterium]